MTELITIMLGSLLRMLLLGLFAVLIERGVWSEGQVTTLATGLAGFITVGGWALWTHYKSRLKFLTALESPAGTTEEAILAKIKTGTGASVRVLLVFLIAGLAITGCGPTTKPTLVKVDSAIYQSVQALHDTAIVLGQAKVITPQQELKIQEAILPVSILGEQATKVLLAWKSGPTPPELQALVREMGLLTQKIIAIVPQNADAKAALLEKVALVNQAIASVLLILGGVA